MEPETYCAATPCLVARPVMFVADPACTVELMSGGTPPPRSATITINGFECTYLECGTGPLALCLHGFPDSAHTWRHLLPQLAQAGYHAVAPFLRGYAPSAVPADGRFQTGALSADANALHEALGGDSAAVIVGHDWGAPATYGAACHQPERWAKVVGMAVPPGGATTTALATNIEQVKRSWYMFFFQHPLADSVVGANDLAFIDMLWRDWSPGFDATEELALLKPSLRDPTNLGAALGYYRAMFQGGQRDPSLDDVQAATRGVPAQPTLYLHGANDGCIGREVSDAASDSLAPNVTVEVVDGCGHFLHLERPQEVNRRIVEFLS
jgi:pimeloyl-ACP methyl ester carboxylesterase